MTRKELRAGLQGLEIEISKGELNEIFAAFDPDGSGQIDFRELNKMLRSDGKVEQAGGAGPTPPQTTKPLRGGGGGRARAPSWRPLSSRRVRTRRRCRTRYGTRSARTRCAALRCAVLCCAVLCCAVLCCASYSGCTY